MPPCSFPAGSDISDIPAPQSPRVSQAGNHPDRMRYAVLQAGNMA